MKAAIWPLAVVASSAILGGSYVVAHRFEIERASASTTFSGQVADAWVLDRLTGRAKLCFFWPGESLVICEAAEEVGLAPASPASANPKAGDK